MVWSRPADCFNPEDSSLGFWNGEAGGVLVRLHGEIEPRNDDLVPSAMPLRTARMRAGNRSKVVAYTEFRVVVYSNWCRLLDEALSKSQTVVAKSGDSEQWTTRASGGWTLNDHDATLSCATVAAGQPCQAGSSHSQSARAPHMG